MKIIRVFFLAIITLVISCKNQEVKEEIVVNMMESYRPSYHFTPPQNWMNDPNGMFYYKGQYHLFYQHNPFGIKWGHMTWGHATSEDMLNWKHQPIAIPEENDIMIFSGSAVVDWKNTSGFGSEENPPIIAIYTGYHTKDNIQEQSIAYSLDEGTTWTKYENNPVLDLGLIDFRDPKVMWYEPENKWIMTVSLAVDRKIQFYSSTNLKDWKLMSEFGPTGSVSGKWECPELFQLKTEDGLESKWILEIDVDNGSPAGGCGAQYFIGEFDGKIFTRDIETSNEGNVNWLDFGKDFYGAVTWSDIPKEDGRTLWIGWMNNWQYATEIPTKDWRSSMSIPREVFLKKDKKGVFKVAQKPIIEINKYLKEVTTIENGSIDSVNKAFAAIPSEKQLQVAFEITLDKNQLSESIALELSSNKKLVLNLTIDATNKILKTTRGIQGNVDFHPEFPFINETPFEYNNQYQLKLYVIVDTSTIEVFVNDGDFVLSNQIFPLFELNKFKLNSMKNLEIKNFKLSYFN